jgi:hypothetical protein
MFFFYQKNMEKILIIALFLILIIIEKIYGSKYKGEVSVQRGCCILVQFEVP